MSTEAQAPDEELSAGVAEGEMSAFGALYDRYVESVYSFALHMLGALEAEEATQEVFLRLWRRAGQFQPGRGSFPAWLMSIARHHFLDRLRRRGLQQRLMAVKEMDEALARAVDPAPDVGEQAWLRERALAVRRAMADLPEEQRRVLVMAYFGGLSQSMIARELNTPLGTVKKRTRLALQKLRASLGELKLFDEENPAARGQEQ